MERNKVLRQQAGEFSSETGAGENPPNPAGSTPGNNEGTGSSHTGTNGGIQSPFSHPALAGRSEEEIATLLTVNQAAVREQGIRLNQLERERQQQQQQNTNQNNGTQSAIPDAPISPTDYWADPGKAAQLERQRTVEAVRSMMEEMVAPLRMAAAEQQRDKVWTEIRAQIPDFVDYEPLVRQLLGRMGNPVPNLELLETLYFTAFGYVQKNGGGQQRQQQPVSQTNNGGNNFRPAPPQHMPANQPLKQQTPAKVVRELTENERTIARMRGLTPEQYIAELENPVLELG